MATRSAPIYKDQDKTYRADTCSPLIDAANRGKVVLKALSRSHYPGRVLDDEQLPGLQSTGYWNATREQDWGLPWHRNEGIELTFLETGTLPFSVRGKTWQLNSGSLTITRPWQQHKVGQPNIEIGCLHWLIIDVGVRHPHQPWQWPGWLVLTPDDLAELTGYLRENEQPVWRATDAIKGCFRQIGGAVEAESGVSRLAVFINELFLNLLVLFRREDVPRDKGLTRTQRSVELFLTSLEERYAEEWTLDAMARVCGLGVTRFVHNCRHAVNLPPMQYLSLLRTRAATEKLRQCPDKTITEIAFECGFSSSQYFATCFRKHYGRTPKQFRTDHRPPR